MVTIDGVVAVLWPGRSAAVEPLTGGITNSNFRVRVGGDDLVVRIPGSRTELLGIDRECEIAASRIAAGLGIGPELVDADPSLGCIVTRFIDGRPLRADEVGQEPVIGQLAAALRLVHGAGAIGATFEPYRLVTRYHELAARHEVVEPFDFRAMAGVVAAVARARPFEPTALCHNDLLTANLLYDGGVRLVDWEYAGMGDPFFDLGNLAANHAFTAEQQVSLLGHYFGEADDAGMAGLELFELVSEAREAMWGVVQMAVSELQVDFEGYAVEHGGGFFRLLANLDLERALRLVATARR